MRRSGAWIQLCLKLGARVRCGRHAPHILSVSDIFLVIRGRCRSVRLARRLKPFTKLFSGLYQFAIWRKERYFEDLYLIQTGVGNKAGPGVYGAAACQAYGALSVQRRAE
jgi:hypothetical protein